MLIRAIFTLIFLRFERQIRCFSLTFIATLRHFTPFFVFHLPRHCFAMIFFA